MAPALGSAALLLLAAGGARAALPEGYCVDNFVDAVGDTTTVRPAPSEGAANHLIVSARRQAPSELDPRSNEEAQAYFQRRLAPSAVFLALWALALLATCPVCTSRLCCWMRCCAPDPTTLPKGKRARRKPRLELAGAWGVLACASVALAGVGIHYAGGISTAISLGACEAVQLADDVRALIGKLNERLDSFGDAGEVVDEVVELLEGSSAGLVGDMDAVLEGLQAFEAAVRAVNISGAEWAEQDALADDTAQARTELSDGRAAVVELSAVLDEASDALVDNADTVRDIADSISDLTVQTPLALDQLEPFVLRELMPVQQRLYWGALGTFAYALGAALLGALGVALLVLRPEHRATPHGLHCAFSCQWAFVLAALLGGGVLIAFPLLLADACALLDELPSSVGEYVQGGAGGARVAGVVEGCFAQPPRKIVDSIGILDGELDLDALISFDALDDISLGSELDYDAFEATRAQVGALAWTDFGLNTTRVQLVDACCEGEGVCCGTEDTCTDDDLDSCSFAPAALELNASVNSALDSLQAEMAALDADVRAFNASAHGVQGALREVEALTEPLRESVGSLDELGECGFVADRYWGVHRALCGVLLPSIFWVAIALCAGGALGIALGALLLAMAKMALVAAAAWREEEMHEYEADRGSPPYAGQKANPPRDDDAYSDHSDGLQAEDHLTARLGA